MPGSNPSPSALSRRQFLERTSRCLAVGTVGLSLLLEACTPPAPITSTAAPATPNSPAKPNTGVVPTSPPAAAAAKPAGILPTYVAFGNKPKPDFPGKDERYEDGYVN